MRTLGSVGVRSFRRAFGRWLLTATGITLGVAVLFAVQVANASASRTVERRFGSAETSTVRLSTADRRTPDEAVSTAAALEGVHLVSTHVGFDARLPDHDQEGEPRLVWLSGGSVSEGPAFDPSANAGPEHTREGIPPRSNRDEVMVGGTTADELDLRLGDELRLDTPTGAHVVRVVEIVSRADGAPTDFGLVTSEETARRFAGDAVVRDAYVLLAPDVDPDDWIDEHRLELPGGVVVSTSGFDSASFREFARAMNDGFAVGALTAVFVGAFLIFLTMSMQVSERTATYGMFRALGATRRQVGRVVLTEAFVLGVLATGLGLAFGAVMAVGLTRVVGQLYEISSPDISITGGAVALAAVTGVTVTLIGAALPAMRAGRLDPVTAMRRDLPEAQGRSRLAAVGAIVAAAGLVMAALRPPTRNDPTILLILGGIVLALPVAVRPLASLVGRATARLAPGVGRVGVLHLEKERRRSAYTMGLIMVVLATVFALGTVKHTFDVTVERIVGRTHAADLFVHAGAGLDDATIDDVAALPEVEALTTFRWFPIRLAGADRVRRAELVAIDADTYFDVLGMPLVEGDQRAVRRALGSGEPAVVISEPDARRLQLHVGDVFPLETPDGDLAVTVVGILANLDGGWHPIFIGDDVAAGIYGGSPVSGLRLAAADGITDRQLEEAVRDELADRTDLAIRGGEEQRSDALRFNDQFFSIFQVVVLVALVVGLLGLANTLAFSVLRRTREVGILRATGTQRRQIVAMIAVEALTLTGAAALLAVPVGIVVAALAVKSVSASLGATIALHMAWFMLPVVGATTIGLALAAALVPARRAARLDPVVSLRFE